MSHSNESTQAEHTSDSSSNNSEIRLNIPSRYVILTSGCGVMGMSLGLIRGSRAEGMRFLAENAHRPPTTLRGWYLYKKTKNYRMMWGGLREGGRKALQLGAIGATFAACEDGVDRVGFGEVKEAGAGVGTAVLFCAFYRLPWVLTRRVVLLGGVVGAGMSLARLAQRRLLVLRDEYGAREVSGR
ncbi:hypothetical protein ACEPAH_5837 [Sanghuangporus vaninii]